MASFRPPPPRGDAGRPPRRLEVIRKTWEPACTLINDLTSRVYKRDNFRDEGYMSSFIQPSSAYQRRLMPTMKTLDRPATAFATRFAYLSVNKTRQEVYCLTWTPEGRRLLTGNKAGEFTLWNGRSFNYISVITAHDQGAVRDMQWSHDENWLLSGDNAGIIKVGFGLAGLGWGGVGWDGSGVGWGGMGRVGAAAGHCERAR